MFCSDPHYKVPNPTLPPKLGKSRLNKPVTMPGNEIKSTPRSASQNQYFTQLELHPPQVDLSSAAVLLPYTALYTAKTKTDHMKTIVLKSDDGKEGTIPSRSDGLTAERLGLPTIDYEAPKVVKEERICTPYYFGTTEGETIAQTDKSSKHLEPKTTPAVEKDTAKKSTNRGIGLKTIFCGIFSIAVTATLIWLIIRIEIKSKTFIANTGPDP